MPSCPPSGPSSNPSSPEWNAPPGTSAVRTARSRLCTLRTRWRGSCSTRTRTGATPPGLQILYEILNERDGRGRRQSYAPGRISRPSTTRCPLSSSSTTATASASACWRSACRLVTYTDLLNCVDLAGVAVRRAPSARRHRWSSPAGTAPTTQEALADFVDAFILGDGERSSVRSTGARPLESTEAWIQLRGAVLR
ncbi:MAG: hypothetical protein R2749_12230 [Acidimicrobiales bacterium]